MKISLLNEVSLFEQWEEQSNEILGRVNSYVPKGRLVARLIDIDIINRQSELSISLFLLASKSWRRHEKDLIKSQKYI